MRKILAVIPIRGGSQGIKNKNIALLAGRPLVSYVIDKLKKTETIDKSIVSTDTEQYVEVVRKYGIDVPFIRPQELGGATIRLHCVMKHALTFYDNLGIYFDAVLSMQATSPLVSSKTINNVIDTFHQTRCKSVATVSKIRHGHPYLAKILIEKEDGNIASDFLKLEKGTPRYPRQIRPDLYYFNGSIFLRDRSLLDNMDEDTNCLGDSPRVVLMNDHESINIDEKIDLSIAEFMIQKIKDG